MILNFKRKRKHGIALKIKGTKIISPQNSKTNILWSWRGNIIMSCFYSTNSFNLVTCLSLLPKKIAAFSVRV